MSSEQFIAALHDELMAAARARSRPPRRRRVVWLAAAAAVIAVVVGGVVTLSTSRPVSADIEVIRQGDELLIRLTDAESRPDEIEAAARDAGLDVRVVEVPVGPSNVGRIAAASAGEGVQDLYRTEGDPSSGIVGFRVPVTFDGQVRLSIGRPAREGERWQSASWSTAVGEPLECEHVEGRPVGEVLELIERRGIERVDLSMYDDPSVNRVDGDLERFADATVIWVQNLDPHSVSITAARDPNARPPVDPSTRLGCPRGD